MRAEDLKKKRRVSRKYRVRKKISGTPERLRLTVFRSLNNIYAQLIDDTQGNTVLSVSTIDKEAKEQIKPDMTKSKKSELVGSLLAKKALEKGIKNVKFDRNGYLYHGRIKTLAEAARKAGLEF
jgi:large subunit ribosomal protein L18